MPTLAGAATFAFGRLFYLHNIFSTRTGDFLATNSEILEAIDEAIVDILQNGQEVTIDGVVYNKANLNSLFQHREKFSQKAASSSDNFFSRMKTGIPRR